MINLMSCFRHLVNYSEKVLEGSLSILPRSGFVAALKSLLADDHDVVRRKALEVGGKSQFVVSDVIRLITLVPISQEYS